MSPKPEMHTPDSALTLLPKGKTKIYRSSPHSQQHQTDILKIHRYLFLAALKKSYNHNFKISTKETGETAQGLSGITDFSEDWSSATPGSLQPPVTVDLNNIVPSSGFYRHSIQMARVCVCTHTQRETQSTHICTCRDKNRFQNRVIRVDCCGWSLIKVQIALFYSVRF